MFVKPLVWLGKFALGLVAVVLLLVVGLVVAFFITPKFEASSDRLKWLVARFPVAGLELTWDDARFTLERDGAIDSKAARFAAKNICVRWHAPAVDVCFADVALGASAAAKNPNTGKWFDLPTQIFPIRLTGGVVKADIDALPKSDETKPSSGGGMTFVREKILPRWHADGSAIDIDRLAVDSGKRKWRGGLRLATAGGPGAQSAAGEFLTLTVQDFRDAVSGYPLATGALKIKWPESGPSPLAEKSQASERGASRPDDEKTIVARAEHAASSADRLKTSGAKSALSTWTAELSVKASLKKNQKVGVEAHAQARAWDDYDYQFDGNFKGFGPLHTGRIAGGNRGAEQNGKLSASIGSVGATVRAASLIDCAYLVNLTNKNGGLSCGPESVRLSVRETVAPPSFRSKRELFNLRPTLEFKALNVEFGNRINADLSAAITLNEPGLLTIDAHADGHVAGPTFADIDWKGKADAALRVPEFASLVKFLSGTPYAVPAPINQLAGPIDLKGDMTIDSREGRAPFILSTRLASRDQRVFTTVGGEANLVKSESGWKTNLRIAVRADDIQLAAPRLALKAPPQIAPDGRFKSFKLADEEAVRKARTPATAQAFSLRTDVQTGSPGAIQIATNMTSSAVPLSMNLSTKNPSPAPPAGAVSVAGVEPSANPGVTPVPTRGEPGRLSTAESESARREFAAPDRRLRTGGASASGSAVSGSILVGKVPIRFLRREANVESMRVDFLPDGRKRLDGRVSVNYPDYDISAYVTGYADAPQLRFESTPPLPQDQILAALLFGKPIGELSNDERSSAANLNAAVADAALSASSLYFLADTPIEGIGYDPDRGLVTARVGLGGGNSLVVGGGGTGSTEVGLKRKLSRDLVLNTYVERVGETDEKIVSAFVEWVKKF